MTRFLIILSYFDRPKMVRGAIGSVLRSPYPHWHLAAVDDGSPRPLEPILREMTAGYEEKVALVRLEDTAERKHRQNGTRQGEIFNQLIRDSDAEAGIILCDDDQLHPDYLAKLDVWLRGHPEAMSCYSKVIVYDPLRQGVEDAREDAPETLDYAPNKRVGAINGMNKVDASMMCWRLAVCKEKGVWWDELRAHNHDADFLRKLFDATGPIQPTGFVGQYKGIHAKQLGVVGDGAAWWGFVDLDAE